MPPASTPDRGDLLLKGTSILVMEDDFLQAADLVAYLGEAGARVIGPFSSLNEGWVGLSTEKRLDAAVLDLMLRGDEQVYPLLVALCDAGIPVLLASGLDRGSLPTRFEALPMVMKPYSAETVGRELSALVHLAGGSPRS